jgi:hypothetical protein
VTSWGGKLVVGVAADGPFVGTSCHIDCKSIGFEPPFCADHSGGTQAAVDESATFVEKFDGAFRIAGT